MTLTIQLSRRSFTAILCPREWTINVAYFSITEITVMAMLTVERVLCVDAVVFTYTGELLNHRFRMRLEFPQLAEM